MPLTAGNLGDWKGACAVGFSVFLGRNHPRRPMKRMPLPPSTRTAMPGQCRHPTQGPDLTTLRRRRGNGLRRAVSFPNTIGISVASEAFVLLDCVYPRACRVLVEGIARAETGHARGKAASYGAASNILLRQVPQSATRGRNKSIRTRFHLGVQIGTRVQDFHLSEARLQQAAPVIFLADGSARGGRPADLSGR